MPDQAPDAKQTLLPQILFALRIHLLVAVAVVVMGLWLHLDAFRWAMLAFAFALAVLAQMMNVLFETVMGLVPTDHNPSLAKAARDVAAGAVLVATLGAVVVGLFVLGPPLLARLGLLK
jgi:diacylglycerol kinase